jgi:LysM repeat protein
MAGRRVIGGMDASFASTGLTPKAFGERPVQRGEALARQICRWQSFAPMKLAAVFLASAWFVVATAFAQTPSPESAKPADAGQIEALAKKIDEQNAKIDALSQEILKLEQQVSHIRPGVMIGESTPAPPMPGVTVTSPHPAAGNTHVVARGETLTSIAKMYKVTVDELQQANHIEDGRKLQAGQTITIPGASSPAPSATPAE